ncbi:MAG TPA: PPC domain-containing protein [Planctomycetaceae bacterium]|nr:PPC domain-containing protein [Planctomycetaceae bacterium]
MTQRKRLLAVAVFMSAILVSSFSSAADPRLSLINPRGGQRGTELEVVFSGNRLEDAAEIFYYEKGFETLKLEPVNANACKALIKIAPDARLGEHVMQVRTKSGISDYRTFWVGPYPSLEEKEPNNAFEQPQLIETVNVTVQGIVQNEDVDYFAVNATKGQRISVEVEGLRLGNTLFDPYCAILDSKRFELAASDDAPLLNQDSLVSVIAPEDGQYIIEIRDSAYQGNGASYYRAHIGTFPRPTAVYPAGGQIGQEVEVAYLGIPGAELKSKLALPAELDPAFGVVAEDAGGIAPSPNVFRLFPHGNAIEAEPNNEFATATKADLPLAFNGIIQEPGDVDCFRFTAKQGEVWEVECHARSLRSPLDPVMNLYNGAGAGITGNDDARGNPDSYFRFSVPADGEYILRITDHLQRGGADFVYRVEFTPVVPKVQLSIPRVTRYGQERQTIYVPRGNRVATQMTIGRVNVGGEVILSGEGLPPGMTMQTPTVPANMSTWPVLFEAAADAPLGGKLLKFTSKMADANVNAPGEFRNFADLILYQNAPLYGREINQLAFAVIEESPYSLEIVQPKVPIVQDGSMELKIIAKRAEGFTKPIRVEFPFRPPGIGTTSAVTIPEGQNEVMYPLNTNNGAAIGKWPVYALGLSDTDSGTVVVSSQMATLEIAPPFLKFAFDRGATEQGKPATIIAKVTHETPFEGEAEVKMIGLPHLVTSPDLKLTKDQAELVFNISTAPESPVGKHKNLYCSVVVMQNGEPITHRIGSSELQIDKPLPPPKDAPPMPMPVAKAEEPKPAAPRQLSRLEKLRLEAEQRKQENQNK